ncbi:MAG: hypothetical protein KA791_15910, partial [Flavobacteriales bacterium]|nr:hypothetical protein [Flavobacteriales bacterium]
MKRLSLSILSLGLALCLMAQAPERIKYQSVVRDGNGAIIVSGPVNFRISVLEGSTSGPSAYTETHTAATNEFGLVNLE